MARRGPRAHVRAGRRAGAGDVPDLERRGTAAGRPAGQAVHDEAAQGCRPAPLAVRARGPRPGPAALRPPRRAHRPGAAVAHARRRGARRGRRGRASDPLQPAHQGGARLLPRRLRGGVGRRKPGDVSLLHALFYTHSNRRPRDAHLGRPGSSAGPGDRRIGAGRRRRWPPRWAIGSSSGTRCAGSSTTGSVGPASSPRRRLGAPRGRRHRRALPPTLAGFPAANTTRRCRPGAISSPSGMPRLRSSRPSRCYPEPFLARGPAQRAGRLGHRAGEGDLRQLTAVRHAWRA